MEVAIFSAFSEYIFDLIFPILFVTEYVPPLTLIIGTILERPSMSFKMESSGIKPPVSTIPETFG